MNVTGLSSQYTVRRMTESDIDRIYELSVGNPLFYQYCPPFVTKESIRKDMEALPPGTTGEDKFYVGFFEDGRLIAVMDLVLNYPDARTSFIGLFMMAREKQGQGIGSRIVSGCASYIRSLGYEFIRLGYAKGNPQSESFWKKNGFAETGVEADNGAYTVVVMQRCLQEK